MRIIDADAMRDELASICFDKAGVYNKASAYYKAVKTVLDYIDNFPTLEYPEAITIKCDTEEDMQKLLSLFRNARAELRVEAERPQGEWIIDEEGSDSTCTLVTCPFCKERMCCKMNFCGNCGADMRGAENDK